MDVNIKEEIFIREKQLFGYYFVWTLAIGLIIYLGKSYEMDLQQEYKITYERPTALLLFTTLFPVGIGILLRLPKFILEVMARTRWTFDWVRGLAVGVPALVVVAWSTLPLTPFGEGMRMPGLILVSQPTLTTVAGVVLGYLMLDSLKKDY
ncbi:hypothetical protein IMZ31_11330 [Pontibacillus sp. ALD_SL1]|uniref:hypothetical protein n=1 Tax=Pontibacillus sp. ALD_SL1 TaxID=2777185 RepID=UPI001A97B2BF|nr:hypothetical protein [Pontibacillus sp. ALD_SL1]QSS98698.1 hypothetical protein IMZ31_11330 [Pontibacillus sp. ALD_SL1]